MEAPVVDRVEHGLAIADRQVNPQRPVARPAPVLPETERQRLEQAWAGGKDPRLTAAIVGLIITLSAYAISSFVLEALISATNPNAWIQRAYTADEIATVRRLMLFFAIVFAVEGIGQGFLECGDFGPASRDARDIEHVAPRHARDRIQIDAQLYIGAFIITPIT